jgi:hypothetical protein
MCTGIEIALLAGGVAASAGGAAMQRADAQRNAAAIARAKNAELRDSMQRQKAYESRNREEGVQKALARFDPAEQAKAQAEDQARRETAITEAVVPTAGAEDIPMAPGLEGAPAIVKGQIGKKLRDVFNTATDRAKLAAKPLTFSDMLAGNNIALTQGGRVVDTGNSFARQEAAMLPSQQEFAGYMAQQTPSIWGPLLSAAGTAAAGAGGSGYFKAAAPAIGALAPGTALPISTLTGRVVGPL